MMDAATFRAWLAEMKEAKLARSEAECARLLGLARNTIANMKRTGADQRTALACRALLHRMEGYR